MSVKELVKAETERLGFPLSGVMAIAPPGHIDVYSRWLDAGLHAEMGYLATQDARERRANPALILPEALALLVVGLRYPSPALFEEEPETEEAVGRVASYAWGVDYHEIIPPLLFQLIEQLQKHPDALATGHAQIKNRLVSGKWAVMDENLIPALQTVKQLAAGFGYFPHALANGVDQ